MLLYRVMNKAPCEQTQQCCQQLPTLLDVTPCVLLHILLRVVGSCFAKFETGQTFIYVQTDATTPIIIVGHQCCTWTLLNTCIALCNWTRHCWMLRCILLRAFASCCAMFDTGQTFSYVQTWLGQQCWELLRPFPRTLCLTFINH